MNTENKNQKENPKVQQLKHPDEQLWREVKAAAVMEGTTITEWVEEALRMRLAETKKSAQEGGKKV